jgi:hypothetical protein
MMTRLKSLFNVIRNYTAAATGISSSNNPTINRCSRYSVIKYHIGGYVISRMVSGRPRIADARSQFQAIPCRVCGGESDNGTGFSPKTLGFTCE